MRALDDEQTDRIMYCLGQLMRETIIGLTESLYLRAAQKGNLRQSNTTIQPRDNNPLKFSAGVDEALENILFRQSEQYLSPVESVREAFSDIKLHQQTLLRSLETAVPAYAARLDPAKLEERVSPGKANAIMGAANKLKYWDLYKDLYSVVTQHPTGELPSYFLEDLARAYEREHERDRATITSPAVEDSNKVNVG